MAMQKFYVGVKAVVKDPIKGLLLIKHTSGFWDMPGGRLDGNETLEEGLIREVAEELPGSKLKSIGEQLGAYRVHVQWDGDISLVLIYYSVEMELIDEAQLSNEHNEVLWVNDTESLPSPMDDGMREILLKAL